MGCSGASGSRPASRSGIWARSPTSKSFTATLRLFAQVGVCVIAGRDVAITMSRPGALLRELQLLGRAGLDPAAVIRSASVNAADRLGLPGDTSRFAPGPLADAILVNADPLASVDALVRAEHIAMVLKDGVPVAVP